MGFFIYMCVTVLLIPAIMIVIGLLFRKTAPKEINYIYGYRTNRSMKSKETWEFAHRCCGRLWLVCGCVLLSLSVIAILFTVKQSHSVTGTVEMVIIFVQLAVLIQHK